MSECTNISEIREHLRFCINEVQIRFSQGRRIESDRAFKIKSWAVTVFIATVAFCITQREALGYVFYFLPLIPIGLFWFLFSYQTHLSNRLRRHGNYKKLSKVMARMYDYSYEELKEISRTLLKQEYNRPNKGRIDRKRFKKITLPSICRIAFKDLSNLVLFGSMVILWILIAVYLIVEGLNNYSGSFDGGFY